MSAVGPHFCRATIPSQDKSSIRREVRVAEQYHNMDAIAELYKARWAVDDLRRGESKEEL